MYRRDSLVVSFWLQLNNILIAPFFLFDGLYTYIQALLTVVCVLTVCRPSMFGLTGSVLLHYLRTHAWRELDGAPGDRAAVYGGRSKGNGQPVGWRVHRMTHMLAYS